MLHFQPNQFLKSLFSRNGDEFEWRIPWNMSARSKFCHHIGDFNKILFAAREYEMIPSNDLIAGTDYTHFLWRRNRSKFWLILSRFAYWTGLISAEIRDLARLRCQNAVHQIGFGVRIDGKQVNWLEKNSQFSFWYEKQKWFKQVKFHTIYGLNSDESGNDSFVSLRWMRFPKEVMLREFLSSHDPSRS